MPFHYRNPTGILGVVVLILCLGTDLAAQLPYTPATAADSVRQQPQPSIRKFTFKHAKAADVLQILQQLAGPTDPIGLKIAVDGRTNSLVFHPDNDQQSREFEQTCVLLDTETPSPSGTGNGVSISVPALGPKPLAMDISSGSTQPGQTFSFSMGFERGEPVETLKRRYEEHEQKAHQLADKLKQSTSLSESDRSELQAAVHRSFEARQALQRAELADLAQRMQSMQQSIDIRDKLADKVVRRRVEDLLNPNLKWDLTEPTAIAQRESSAKPKSIKEAVSAILLNAKSDSVPYKLATVGILYEGKAEIGDFKEEIFEQVEAEARTFVHFQLISRRVANAAMADSRLRLKDLFVAENAKSFFPVMTRFGQSMDFLLLLRLEEVDVSIGESEGNFCLTLRLVDQTGKAFTEKIDVSKGKRADDSKQSTQQFTQRYSSPQELLDALEQHGKRGSYGDFVTLFNDAGVRDLAGSLLMSAIMQTSIDELARQQTTGGLAEVDPGTVAVRKVLQRWLPQSLSADQREYVGKGLSTMMSSIGGVKPDQAALKEYVISMRKSVEGISDHRKFCVEIMQAYEKLTTKPIVYFGNADQKNEWQISKFGERAIATLIDGKPGMATTITLQQANGTWRIASLFNELVTEAQPITASPNATEAEQSNSKTITRRYSVGSFVTESFFTGKGSYDTKDVYEGYETEISQSLEEFAKTVTATCSQPPKFVQVLSSSRCLLIGHTETGHQEIANFMSDIGISNDRIRLRGVEIEITKDEAKLLGIQLTQHVLSPAEVEKLREFPKSKPPEQENSNDEVRFVAMDDTLASGTQRPLKINGKFPIPVTIAARIVPGSKQIQIRTDMHDLGNAEAQYVAPRFQMLGEGQSVLFAIADDIYWLATADIIRDGIAVPTDLDKPSALSATSSTPAMEMQQRLQGEWDVEVMGYSADVSDKRPYQAVVRGQLFLLQCIEDGKVIETSTWKMIWPEADHPDVVDIVWDPNYSSDEHFCPGRVACDGKSFQVAWRSDDSTSGPAIRPTEISSGDGVSYFECVRKQPTTPSQPTMNSNVELFPAAGPTYSGRPISWWLDNYWDNATANPKSQDNGVQEYVATEAIRKLHELPACQPAIEAALAKWFASVKSEYNEIQLVRAAKCIIVAAGPKHQKLAVDYLYTIWKRLPTLSIQKLMELMDGKYGLNDESVGELVDGRIAILKQLEPSDELASQFATKLEKGNSAERGLVMNYFHVQGLDMSEDKESKLKADKLNAWLRSHDKLFAQALEAASHDENEEIRTFALLNLFGVDKTFSPKVLQRLSKVIESDPSAFVRMVAMDMLNSNECGTKLHELESQLKPWLVKSLAEDSESEVRLAAIRLLSKFVSARDLVHTTVLDWAKSQDETHLNSALTFLQYESGRPQSIVELNELLSDPHWGKNLRLISPSQVLARRHAITILGELAPQSQEAVAALEAEVARNIPETANDATKVLERFKKCSEP